MDRSRRRVASTDQHRRRPGSGTRRRRTRRANRAAANLRANRSTCCRSKGDVSASASSVAGRACHAPSRANNDAVAVHRVGARTRDDVDGRRTRAARDRPRTGSSRSGIPARHRLAGSSADRRRHRRCCPGRRASRCRRARAARPTTPAPCSSSSGRRSASARCRAPGTPVRGSCGRSAAATRSGRQSSTPSIALVICRVLRARPTSATTVTRHPDVHRTGLPHVELEAARLATRQIRSRPPSCRTCPAAVAAA